MFRNILLALDLNAPEEDKGAIGFVKDHIASHGDAAVHAVTVVPDFQMSIVGSFFPADFEKKALGEAQNRLHAMTDEAFGKGKAQCIIAHGDIYKEIIRVADEIKADLIVMGSGKKDVGDYLLGTNAARVVRHARTSVLVVR